MKTRAKTKQDYMVEKILRMRTMDDNRRQFQVKWIGWDDSQNTWEFEGNLMKYWPQLTRLFLKKNPPGTKRFKPVLHTEVQEQRDTNDNEEDEGGDEDEQMSEQQQQQQQIEEENEEEEEQQQQQSQEEEEEEGIPESQCSTITQTSSIAHHQTCNTSSLSQSSSSSSSTTPTPQLPSAQVKFLCKATFPGHATGDLKPSDRQSVLQFFNASDNQLECFIIISQSSMYMAEVKMSPQRSPSCSVTKVEYSNGVKPDPNASILVSYGKNEVISLHNNMFSIFELEEETVGGLKKFTLTGEKQRPVPQPSGDDEDEPIVILDHDDNQVEEKRIDVIPPLLHHPFMQHIVVAPVIQTTLKGGEETKEVFIQAFDLSVTKRNWRNILLAQYRDTIFTNSDDPKIRQIDFLDDPHNLAVVSEVLQDNQRRRLTFFARFDDSFTSCSRLRTHWKYCNTSGEELHHIETLHGGDAVLIRDMTLILLPAINHPAARTSIPKLQFKLSHKYCCHCVLDYRNKILAVADTDNKIHMLAITENGWCEVEKFSVADKFTKGAIVMAMQTYGATAATRGAAVDKWKGTLLICSTHGDVLAYKSTLPDEGDAASQASSISQLF